jgi:hypothetical protein
VTEKQDRNTGAARLAGFGAAGTWLIVLISISVFVAVVIFSATQFQTRLANLAVSGKALSVWKADQLREGWAANVLSLNNATKDLQSARKTSEQNRQTVDTALAALREFEAQGYKRLNALKERVSPGGPELAKELDSTAWGDVPAIVRQHIDKSKISEFSASLDAFVTAREKWLEANRKLEGAKRTQDSIEDVLQKRSKDFEEAKTHLKVPDEDASVENVIYEFQTMYEHYPLSYYVSLAPSDLLALILVIAMGVLGASLQLSFIYTTEFARRPISYYIFRPFLGIITALVIFIVTKAGIPLIADTNKLSTNVPINPYFIAF